MSKPNDKKNTGASSVASSDWLDVCAVYARMKKDIPYILDGIVSELGDAFARPTTEHPALAAEDALYQLSCVRQFQGPLEKPLSLYALQLEEIKQTSDGVLAARLYKARSEQEILPSNAKGSSAIESNNKPETI